MISDSNIQGTTGTHGSCSSMLDSETINTHGLLDPLQHALLNDQMVIYPVLSQLLDAAKLQLTSADQLTKCLPKR